MTEAKRVLALMAHPDDVEFTCAGVLTMLRAKGWEVHIGTMTPGDCGSEELDPAEISAIRRAEGASAAALLDGTYHCLECRDCVIPYDEPTIRKTVDLLRKVRPSLVIAASPDDYMIDHEVASRLVRNATFLVGIPNFRTEPNSPYRPVPHLYYADPLEGKDLFGADVAPTTVVDIQSAMDMKSRMLRCHASQREWLLKQHGLDEYVNAMLDMGRHRGKIIGVEFAEGFRQHRGHGYPQDNLLAAELGSLVHELRPTAATLADVRVC
jgi:N-acetylglucosamine malate deacetylase 1